MAIFIGTDGDDTLTGTETDDIFIGGEGDDDIFGLGGADVAFFDIIDDGSDRVNLGSGLDTVVVDNRFGSNIRLTFTSSEVGNGSANDAGTMTNQDGGLAVRMQVEGGAGNLFGQVSRFDDEGITFVSTNATFDVRDLVFGSQRGNLFQSVQLGTSGGDLMVAATSGAAYFNAGMGDDTINGGDGDDFLVGGAGNDSLTGGMGSDSLLGGSGNDTAVLNVTNDGADTVDLGDVGDDEDIVVVNADSPTEVRLTFTSSEVGNGNVNDSGAMTNQDGGLAVRLQAEDGSDGLTGSVTRVEDEMISFVAGDGVRFDVRDLVFGTQRGNMFDVVTLGSMAGDVIDESGELENYYINVGMGDDSVRGGQGDDFLVGGAGNDTLSAGRGNDSFIGGGGNDLIFGGDGSDRAIMNITTDGSDRVDLGDDGSLDFLTINATAPTQVRLTFTSSEVGNGSIQDSNTMANQDGGLAIRMQAEDGADGLTGSISRVEDENVLFIAGPGVKFDVRDLVSGTERGNFFDVVQLGSSGGDMIDQSDKTIAYYINAGMGNDTITGSRTQDFLVGGAGDDSISGEFGRDTVLGGGGNDRINGNLNNDSLDGGDGDDRLLGNDGNDILLGGIGLDRLEGGAGKDSLTGGDGNDSLFGGADRDTMTGGAGADRFVFVEGDVTGNTDGVDVDRILDFSSADGDQIDLRAVDADTGTAGDQAFTFVGTDAFTGMAGELRYETSGGRAILTGDTDGDGVGDFQIRLDNGAVVTAADFLF